MSKNWCITGFVLIGGISLVNLAWFIRSTRMTSVDKNAAITPFVATQNNLYPNGKFANVGTRAATPSKRYPKTAEQGGDSVVTSSTGRWAA